MNSFSGQGKALPVEIRNIIVGKWLHNEGIASTANIIQYLIQYLVLVLLGPVVRKVVDSAIRRIAIFSNFMKLSFYWCKPD